MPEVEDGLKMILMGVLIGISARIVAWLADVTVLPFLGQVSGGYIPPTI
jgi:hypothetical protein